MRFASLSIIAACCLLVCTSSAHAQGWQKETILPFATFYSPSLAIGADHIPRIAATSQNGVTLYLSRLSSGWQQETISQDWSWVQGSRGLRFGPDGRPHIFGGSYLYTYSGSAWIRTNARFTIWEGGMA